MTRQEFINVLLPLIIQDGADRATADRIVEMKTTSELGLLYARFVREGRIKLPTPTVTQADADQAARHAAQQLETIRDQHAEALSRARAERNADAILFKHRQDMDREPQRQTEAAASLARDRAAFDQAAKQLRSFARNDANFHLCRRVLGGGNVSVQLISEGIASGALQLSKITQTELDEYRAADVEQRNRRLLDMPIHELKREVRREQAENRATASQRESNELLEEMRVRDLQVNLPPLPTHDQSGVLIDANYLKKLCNIDLPKYKHWLRRFGGYALTLRLQGRT